jgi:methionyl-tRNA formyltransferase
MEKTKNRSAKDSEMPAKRLRVVFMGTPEFAVRALETVHAAHDIVGVYTQPDKPVGRGLDLRSSPVKVKALEYGLSVFQPEKLSLPGEFEKLQALAPDAIVVVAYGQILRRDVLDLPRLGCINIHSSLLPRWRGAAPIQWAILGGDSESGISTMHLVEKLDAGDVLLQARTPISAVDTAGTLHDRLMIMGAELILPTLAGLADGTIKGQPQDVTQVTYASKLTKEMEALNAAESAETLDRRVRALNPWPGTSLWIAGQNGAPAQRLKVKRATPRLDIQGPQGKLFEKLGMLLYGTASGSLQLQSVQWDGKKEVDAGGFLNGLKGRGQALPLETANAP